MNTNSQPDERHADPASPEAMRIVVFSDAYGYRNGVGAYYCDLLEHLRPRIGSVEVVCPGVTPEGKQQGLSFPLPGDPSQRLSLPGIRKAWRTVRRVRPHVIVAASPGPYGMLGAALAKRFRTRFCFGYHTQYDMLTGLYWNRLFGGIAKRYLAWLDRRFFKRSDAVFTNGRHMVAIAESMGARRIQLIGTPVDKRLLGDPVPIQRDAFGPVVFVGRLALEKNVDKVIDAARELPDIPFAVAGDGPLVEVVRQAEADIPNLDYVGWLDRETLLTMLDERCEILVLPSQVESFGTVAAEAMARERLVLVSDRCGIADWPELTPGLEVTPLNEPLAPKLAQLAQMTPETRAAKRRRARECCVRFVQKTVNDWKNTLYDVACQ